MNRKRIVSFDNGEQVLIEDSPSEMLSMHVEIGGATVVDDSEIDIDSKGFKELSEKAKTNSVDIDTISVIMKSEKKENKKGGRS